MDENKSLFHQNRDAFWKDAEDILGFVKTLEPRMENLELKSELEPNTIRFDLGKSENEAIILLKENGDIFVKGKLIENDKEVVDAMREFLKHSGFIK